MFRTWDHISQGPDRQTHVVRAQLPMEVPSRANPHLILFKRIELVHRKSRPVGCPAPAVPGPLPMPRPVGDAHAEVRHDTALELFREVGEGCSIHGRDRAFVDGSLHAVECPLVVLHVPVCMCVVAR